VELSLPPSNTLERWAYDYIVSSDLDFKEHPPDLPVASAVDLSAMRLERPGRPAELRVTWEKYKAPKTAHALRSPLKRAHLLHTFFHHELQAAELLCWAMLAFPNTPPAFKRGLLAICLDEVRHMSMYRTHIEALGFTIGSFSVRDWFWERAPKATSAVEFVALMGLGFEAGNLDHTARYVTMFREAGDEAGARLQETVGAEEVAHVAFGAHWFRQLEGPLSFRTWCARLPAPLSPMVMRGRPLHREARLRASLDETFLEELEAWQPTSPGS
jgi:uncharacterized ferritin-like protein (DUF455 family)